MPEQPFHAFAQCPGPLGVLQPQRCAVSDHGYAAAGTPRTVPNGCGGHVPGTVQAVRRPVAPSVAPTAAQNACRTEMKKPPTLPFWLVGGFSLCCAPEGTRTPNLLIRSQMLYPLSYGRLLLGQSTHRLSRGDSGIRTREGL